MPFVSNPICVTGATGFVGREVVDELLHRGYHVRAIVRESSSGKLRKSPLLTPVTGEVLMEDDLFRAMEGCAAVIHMVGMRRADMKKTKLSYEDVDLGSVLATLKAMQRTNVRRLILLSAASIGESLYVRVKRRAEEAVMTSGISWTIFRPAYITGPGQEWPKLMAPFLGLMAMLPGHLGEVGARAQNVTRTELASAMVWTLEHEGSIGRAYDVPAIRKLQGKA